VKWYVWHELWCQERASILLVEQQSTLAPALSVVNVVEDKSHSVVASLRQRESTLLCTITEPACVWGLCHLTLCSDSVSTQWMYTAMYYHRASVCVCVVSVIWHCAQTECLPSECTLLCTITEPACVCVVSVIWHCAQTECPPSECTLLCTITEPACVCGLCHLTLYYHRASVCEWSLSFDIVPRLSVCPVNVHCCVLSQSQHVCEWSLSFDIVPRLSVYPVSVYCCVLSQSQRVCVCGLCHLTLYYHRASVCVWSLSFDIVLSQSQHVCVWSLSFDIVPRLSVYPVSVHCCVLSRSQRVCVVSVIWHCTITEPACAVSVIWHCAKTECLPGTEFIYSQRLITQSFLTTHNPVSLVSTFHHQSQTHARSVAEAHNVSQLCPGMRCIMVSDYIIKGCWSSLIVKLIIKTALLCVNWIIGFFSELVLVNLEVCLETWARKWEFSVIFMIILSHLIAADIGSLYLSKSKTLL